jgi:hypothetical protein
MKATPPRACGTFTTSGAEYNYAVKGVNCAEARRLFISYQSTGREPTGWYCAASVLVCWRGSPHVPNFGSARYVIEAWRVGDAPPIPLSSARPKPIRPARYVIQGDQSFGGVSVHGRLRDAIARFGKPTSAHAASSGVVGPSCAVSWRSIGLTILTLPTGKPSRCSPDAGIARVTVTGRDWRTSLGLEVGISQTWIGVYHPKANLVHGCLACRSNEWSLGISRPACEGTVPTLLARVTNGRISALVILGATCF